MKKLAALVGMLSVGLAQAHTLNDPTHTKITETFDVVGTAPTAGAPQKIIFGMDNSASFTEEVAGILKGVPKFFSSIGSAGNWQMGMITTDQNNNPLAWGFSTDAISSVTSNPSAVLSSWITQAGNDGDPTEQFFNTAVKAITANPGFLKAGDDVNFIFATDEDDQSGLVPAEFVQHIRTAAPGVGAIRVNGIIRADDIAGCAAESNYNYKGSVFEQAIAVTHGSQFSACSDASIEAGLAALGTEIDGFAHASGDVRKLYLQQKPDVTSIVVSYNAVPLPQGAPGSGYWLYDSANRLVYLTDMSFVAAGDTDAQVEVRYQVAK